MSATNLLVAATVVTIPLSASAGTLTTLYTFSGGTDFGQPSAQLVYQNGALYGVTPAFDVIGQQLGNVFKFDIKTQSLTVAYSFKGGTDGNSPNDLIYDNGMFYGTTIFGGITGCIDGAGCGTVFALNAKTGKETILYSFPDPGNGQQPQPGGLIYESGVLYGVTTYGGNSDSGVIFAINLSTGVETTLYEFTGGSDGQSPNNSLALNKGLLYGTAEHGSVNSCKVYTDHIGCGVVFSVDPTTGAESTVYAFTDGADGFWPAGNLIYHKGLLYGGTVYGGDMSCGGMGCGTFFSVDPSTGAEDVLRANTGLPQAISGLTDHGASVYETLFGTDHGTHIKFGELVKFDLGSGHETVLHKFTNGADGSHPEFPLTYHSGVYYGTTTFGAHSGCIGNLGCGTIFQYVP
jgi:uncharacterized repeat protein (TIGR03803 family)